MLPGADTVRTRGSSSISRYFYYLPEYFRRLIHYPQMDFESAQTQMLYLCFRPSEVYRMIHAFNKQTKNQWARDDPAFVAILLLFMTVASLAYSFAFRVTNFLSILKIIFWSVFIDFVGIGVLIASFGWWLSNRLRIRGALHSVDQNVEWLYAFDIHCNAFFPLFIILYLIQFFLLPLIMSTNILSTVCANTLYLTALIYYYYITFLGYNKLPFLRKEYTIFILYPIGFLFVFYIISLLINWNVTIFVMNFYFYNVTKS